ncbi:MAG: TlpA disulfide reductase family protein [Acidobacteriota bacterium]
MKSRWIAAVAAACAVALLTVPWMLRGSKPQESAPAPAAVNEHESGPANLGLTLKDMHGASVRLADYKGKVILLNIWATWCGPCQTEIPELVASYEAYKDKGVVVLGVSLDDSAETLRAYAPTKKISYPMLLMQDDVDQAYGPFFGVPVTIFIGRDGMISRKHLGPVSKEQVDREIKTLL